MRELAVLPCGKAKIWDKHPYIGPQQARHVYISPFHRATRAYAEQFIGDWVILSAKHGLLLPSDLVSENYDLTFSMKSSAIISKKTLHNQIKEKRLEHYEKIVVIAGKKYHRVVEDTFKDVQFCYPLNGYGGIGFMLQALKRAVASNKQIECKEKQ